VTGGSVFRTPIQTCEEIVFRRGTGGGADAHALCGGVSTVFYSYLDGRRTYRCADHDKELKTLVDRISGG
jgi:hypothetical protein